MSSRTGGRILVDQLRAHGVRQVFCVPGESYLAVLDALHESGIGTIVCRQEGGAAYMAEAAGKMTGQPGIVMVTRGPGATNASGGIHVAAQDSTPLLPHAGEIGLEHGSTRPVIVAVAIDDEHAASPSAIREQLLLVGSYR